MYYLMLPEMVKQSAYYPTSSVTLGYYQSFFFFFIFANQMAFSSKGTEWGHNLNFFSISLLAICIFCELPSHVFFLFSFTCHSFINLKLFFFWPSVDLHIAKSNKVFKFLSLSDQPRMITYLFCFIT